MLIFLNSVIGNWCSLLLRPSGLALLVRTILVRPFWCGPFGAALLVRSFWCDPFGGAHLVGPFSATLLALIFQIFFWAS